MLYLTRKINEGITIISPTGEELRFRIGKIQGKQIHLAFEKFKNWGVWRDEVYDRIKHGQERPKLRHQILKLNR